MTKTIGGVLVVLGILSVAAGFVYNSVIKGRTSYFTDKSFLAAAIVGVILLIVGIYGLATAKS